MKFLIDECLSPVLARIARDRGFPLSTHVTWLGLRSKSDWVIVRRAVQDGYVLVTNNTADFTPLIHREDIHAGLICLKVAPGLMNQAVQEILFEVALDRLAGEEPINDVIEITLTVDRSIEIEQNTQPFSK